MEKSSELDSMGSEYLMTDESRGQSNLRGEAPVGRLIENVLANLGLGARFREQRALLLWPEIVGATVAAHTRAETVRDKVLLIATDTPAWAQELQMRSSELLTLLSKHIGADVIREIRFRGVGRLAAYSFKRRLRPGGIPHPSEMNLSPGQVREIEAAAARIEDADLRQRALRAFTSLARVNQWRKQTGWRRCGRCGQWQRVGRRWCASCIHITGARRPRRRAFRGA